MVDLAGVGTAPPPAVLGVCGGTGSKEGGLVPTSVLNLCPFSRGHETPGARQGLGPVECRWLEWMEKQGEGPCSLLPLIYPITRPVLRADSFPL